MEGSKENEGIKAVSDLNNTAEEKGAKDIGYPSVFSNCNPARDLKNLKGQDRKLQKSARE